MPAPGLLDFSVGDDVATPETGRSFLFPGADGTWRQKTADGQVVKLPGVPASRLLTAGSGLAGGGDLTADRTLSVGAAADGSILVTDDAVGVGVLATNAQHGDRGGGTLHALATTAAAGFMSAAQVAALDAAGSASRAASLTTAPAAVTSGAEVIALSLTLPANSLTVGTTLRLTAYGTHSGTAPTLVARIRLGTLGTTSDTLVCASGAGAVTSGTGWESSGLLTVRAAGASGAAIGNVRGGGSQVSAQTATVAVNTTIANILSLGLVGAATASPSLQITMAAIEVVKS